MDLKEHFRALINTEPGGICRQFDLDKLIALYVYYGGKPCPVCEEEFISEVLSTLNKIRFTYDADVKFYMDCICGENTFNGLRYPDSGIFSYNVITRSISFCATDQNSNNVLSCLCNCGWYCTVQVFGLEALLRAQYYDERKDING